LGFFLKSAWPPSSTLWRMNGPEPTAVFLISGLASHSRGTIADSRLLPTLFVSQAYGFFVVRRKVVLSTASYLSIHVLAQE